MLHLVLGNYILLYGRVRRNAHTLNCHRVLPCRVILHSFRNDNNAISNYTLEITPHLCHHQNNCMYNNVQGNASRRKLGSI